jgi:cytochrome c biogenesis protein CcdA/thiol-disulfide isomerase/thioredoxin
MLILLGIGFVAGIVTALSPCVLPVLPIVLAGGATGRRPLAIVAGIVASFTVFTLFAAWLLDLLGLPEDVLRNLAIVLLLLVSVSLLVPRVGELLARPFQALTRRGSGNLGGGVLLGASLGLVFVPCAGPTLAAITTLAARRDIGWEAVLLTLSYALGAALPMLAIAFAGQRAARPLKAHAQLLRMTSGVLIGAVAIAVAFGADTWLSTRVPGYVQSVQDKVERSGAAKRELRELTGAREPKAAAGIGGEGVLQDYGPAPEFAGLVGWLNSKPLTLESLRGRVVLIDFWTYSCINCLRTLPYIRAWDDRYRDAGLTIVGVHTPEFAFERVHANVRENVRRLQLHYPVALDNHYGTWNAWHNQYWPAKYLIDRNGHVRWYHFGEGEYGKAESVIRRLLAERGGPVPAASGLHETTPHELVTPESYLGYERLERYSGPPVTKDAEHAYSFPQGLAENDLAFAGRWRFEGERAIAGRGARLRLQYRARNVYLVLTGTGSVKVLVDGKPERTVRVHGDRLYTLVERPRNGSHLLELGLSRGLAGYAFTFG